MNDLERELRALLTEDALKAPLVTRAPETIRRRVRRRQLRTGAIAGATTLAVVFAALVSFRTLTDRTGTHVPADTTGRLRTAAVTGATITYPNDWYLTTYLSDHSSDAEITLSSFDPDLSQDDPCAAMPPDGVLLRIQPDTVFPGVMNPDRWPVELRPSNADDACPGKYSWAYFTTPVGRTFIAKAAIGPRASGGDRDRLLAAFAGLDFAPYDQQVAAGPGAVLASGSIGDRPWTLSAGVGDSRSGIALSLDTSQEGGGLSGSGNGNVAAEHATDITLAAPVMHGITLLYGAVASEVARVEVRPDGATAFNADLVELPATLRTSIRAFVAPMLGAPRGTLTTYDSSGEIVSEVPFSPGLACWPAEPCPGAATPGGPVAKGTSLGSHWQILEREGEIRLADDGGHVLGSVPARPDGLAMTSVTFRQDGKDLLFPFGVAPQGASSVVLFTSGLPSDATTAELTDGRLVFWAPLTPASEHGQILAFDSSCHLLAAVDIATGEPAEKAALTDCGTGQT